MVLLIRSKINNVFKCENNKENGDKIATFFISPINLDKTHRFDIRLIAVTMTIYNIAFIRVKSFILYNIRKYIKNKDVSQYISMPIFFHCPRPKIF